MTQLLTEDIADHYAARIDELEKQVAELETRYDAVLKDSIYESDAAQALRAKLERVRELCVNPEADGVDCEDILEALR